MALASVGVNLKSPIHNNMSATPNKEIKYPNLPLHLPECGQFIVLFCISK
ncbi:hypothetical protein CCAN12_330006 [Capnocytophaga canimorsus]|uniref:Uncharacterized protein n=1 Tax=Capnocytophaga canimorsus TaxID=28188 RepID=A0A0B7I774_9FLAO|nr:hypothetical protein CCAN12_330006 [Capnocytophaga canimorsus]CEN47585.1 hypothetical protein CCAN11_1470010 [Capnocytophaga canimorsus]